MSVAPSSSCRSKGNTESTAKAADDEFRPLELIAKYKYKAFPVVQSKPDKQATTLMSYLDALLGSEKTLIVLSVGPELETKLSVAEALTSTKLPPVTLYWFLEHPYGTFK
jgi:hypothetical protein